MEEEATKRSSLPLMLYTFWTLVVYCTASGKVLELVFSIFLWIVYLSAVSMSPWPLITKDLESNISIIWELAYVPTELPIRVTESPIRQVCSVLVSIR